VETLCAKEKNHYGLAKPRKSIIPKKLLIIRNLYSQPFAVVTLLNYNKRLFVRLSHTLIENFFN